RLSGQPVQTVPMTVLGALSRDVESMKGQVNALLIAARSPSERPTSSAMNALTLECEVLGESWKRFKDNKDVATSLERAARDTKWQEIRDPLLLQLPQAVPDDLKATFDAVLAPARDYHNLITKLSLIPRLINGDLPKLENEAQEVTRARELTYLLAMTLNSN